MTTLASPKPARKPRTIRAPRGTVTLSATINGTTYALRILTPQAGSGVRRLVRLRKSQYDGGECYHVAQFDDGSITCDCPAFEFGHAGNPEMPACKHIAALIATRMIDPLPARPREFGRGIA